MPDERARTGSADSGFPGCCVADWRRLLAGHDGVCRPRCRRDQGGDGRGHRCRCRDGRDVSVVVLGVGISHAWLIFFVGNAAVAAALSGPQVAGDVLGRCESFFRRDGQVG